MTEQQIKGDNFFTDKFNNWECAGIIASLQEGVFDYDWCGLGSSVVSRSARSSQTVMPCKK